MFTTDNYECTWDLFKSIPSLDHPGLSVYDETVAFNERRRAKVPVKSIGFSMQDRVELFKLTEAAEESLGVGCLTGWLSPSFFETEFWYLWSTTFAFQPWHADPCMAASSRISAPRRFLIFLLTRNASPARITPPAKLKQKAMASHPGPSFPLINAA